VKLQYYAAAQKALAAANRITTMLKPGRRPGRSSASLPDDPVLVQASRQAMRAMEHENVQDRVCCARKHPERRFHPRGGIESLNVETRPLDAPEAINRNESSDGYGDVVADLNRQWRVIRCRDGIQWILQSRDSATTAKGVWRGRSYCRTKEVMLRDCAAHAGELDPTAVGLLAELPDRIEAPGLPSRSTPTFGAPEKVP